MANGTSDKHLATTEFVMNAFAYNDAMIFKGTISGLANTQNNGAGALTPAADRGHTYKISAAGYVDGVAVEIGDIIICTTDSTSAATTNNYTTTINSWAVIQTNLDGAVIGPSSSTTDHVAVFDGATGKLLKDSGYTIATSVPQNAVFTDTTYTNGDGISIINNVITNTGILSVEEGSTDGTIAVNGLDVSVYGLNAGAFAGDATSEDAGILKLYETTGNNDDGAMTQECVTDLFTLLVSSFGLTLQLPTAITWDTTDGLTATPTTFADTTDVTIQKYSNNTWVNYVGEPRVEGDRFRAYCTRSLFGAAAAGVVGSEYVEPAPPAPEPNEEEPEEEP